MGKMLTLVGLALVALIAFQTIQNRQAAEKFSQWQREQLQKQAEKERLRLARQLEYERQQKALQIKRKSIAEKMRKLRARENRKMLSKVEEHAGDDEFLDYLDRKDEIAAEQAREEAKQEELDDFSKRMGLAVSAIMESAHEMGAVAPVPEQADSARADPEQQINQQALRAAEAFKRQQSLAGGSKF